MEYYCIRGRRGMDMVLALVFLGYLAIMFLPNLIMVVIENYSYHVRAEKKHKRQLDKIGYYDKEKEFSNDSSST